MTVKVRIPAALRSYAGGESIVEVADVSTVGEALQALVARHSQLRPHLLDENGDVREFVNLYLNQQDVRTLGREATRVRAGDTVLVLPSVAGG